MYNMYVHTSITGVFGIREMYSMVVYKVPVHSAQYTVIIHTPHYTALYIPKVVTDGSWITNIRIWHAATQARALSLFQKCTLDTYVHIVHIPTYIISIYPLPVSGIPRSSHQPFSFVSLLFPKEHYYTVLPFFAPCLISIPLCFFHSLRY